MPRKSRKKVQPEAPATEPQTVAAILEASPAFDILQAARDAKSRVEPERPEQDESPSHVQQLGPRKRAPNEPGSVCVGKDFKLLKDADRWYFEFKEEPTEERLRVLKHLDYRPKLDPRTLKPNAKSWRSYDWAKATAYSQSAAVWVDGKDISHGRTA